MKIISGGQTGVDQVGLRIAKQFGYDTGGMVPKGCITDDGPAPWLVTDYGCVESEDSGYRVRTIWNVRNSDLTVWWGDVRSPGGRLTKGTAEPLKRWLENPSGEFLAYTLRERKIQILNVAGNRLRTNPDASVRAEIALRRALKLPD
jgi:Circularly permutated YpsA SLOG family